MKTTIWLFYVRSKMFFFYWFVSRPLAVMHHSPLLIPWVTGILSDTYSLSGPSICTCVSRVCVLLPLFHWFASLNQRFDQLTLVYLKENFPLNLHSMSTYDLFSIWRFCLPEYFNEIISICFSNDDQSPLEIQ